MYLLFARIKLNNTEPITMPSETIVSIIPYSISDTFAYRVNMIGNANDAATP